MLFTFRSAASCATRPRRSTANVQSSSIAAIPCETSVRGLRRSSSYWGSPKSVITFAARPIGSSADCRPILPHHSQSGSARFAISLTTWRPACVHSGFAIRTACASPSSRATTSPASPPKTRSHRPRPVRQPRAPSCSTSERSPAWLDRTIRLRAARTSRDESRSANNSPRHDAAPGRETLDLASVRAGDHRARRIHRSLPSNLIGSYRCSAISRSLHRQKYPDDTRPRAQARRAARDNSRPAARPGSPRSLPQPRPS